MYPGEHKSGLRVAGIQNRNCSGRCTRRNSHCPQQITICKVTRNRLLASAKLAVPIVVILNAKFRYPSEKSPEPEMLNVSRNNTPQLHEF